MTKQLKADLALLLVAIGWGSSFILTKNSLAHMETYNFLSIRFILAFVISSIIFHKKMLKIDKKTIQLGILVGSILYAGYAFQTVGLKYTTVSKSAFISGINVILVPLFAAFLLKTMPQKAAIIGAVVAFVGLGLLTLNGKTATNIGDFYTLLCAILFALYIIAVGKFTVYMDSVSFAVIQLGVVGLLSLMTTFIIEKPIIPRDPGIWMNIVILSVVCTSGALIVQSVAQKFTSPTHTALIFSGEPVFAAIFGYLMDGEVLHGKGVVGAILILLGMVVAELDVKILLKPKNREQLD